jgi:6-pyruvoyltetrahydropterin/6-carboxytetrahydropterin synthase
MFEISSEASFSAAHCLRHYNGPCEKLHGHNWLVRATVRCESLNELGIGIDFKALKDTLREVVSLLDHTDLNAIFDPRQINPSSENIAHYIFDGLRERLSAQPCLVWRVDVYETPGNCAAYFEHA